MSERSEMIEHGGELLDRAQPILDQLEAMPFAEAMAMLAYVTGVMMSHPDVSEASVSELLMVHAKCTAPQLVAHRQLRAVGRYPRPKRVVQ